MLYRVMLPNLIFQNAAMPSKIGLHPDPPAPTVAFFIDTFLVHCRERYDRDSTGTSVDGRAMGFSSAPPPLSARLRPVREKW
jgi:hypothetical protein